MQKPSLITKRSFYFLLVLMNFELFKGNSIENCGFNIDSLVTKRIAMREHTIWEGILLDEMECAKHCVKRRICKSFNFDTESKRCELNDEILTDGVDSREADSLMYSDITVWPSQIDPDCYDRPCGDDEVCIPGQLTGGSNCSYACFKLPIRCPIPEGTQSGHPRTVGSIFEFSCEREFVGGDTALCLPTGQWNKTIDTTCSPLYGSSCTMDTECGPINGSCIDSTCQCNGSYTYNSTQDYCVLECEPNWLLFEEKCYLLEMNEMQYLDATAFCDGHNSHLVQVDSAAENDFLRDRMRDIQPAPNVGYWNDLFEVTTNGNERWRTSNDSYDTQGWYASNPNDYGGKESCTIFWRKEDYSWADMVCVNDVRVDGNFYGYPNCRPVCEKDL